MPPGEKDILNATAVEIRNKLADALSAVPLPQPDVTPTEEDTKPGNRSGRQLRDLQNAVTDAIQNIDNATT